mmetsp:Transcript_4361/g.5836  ORF Transcript_4361/g.5836 Transcript_4361/m.5836 type:complete len:214 (+) Transcript_4361:619-1260(+)
MLSRDLALNTYDACLVVTTLEEVAFLDPCVLVENVAVEAGGHTLARAASRERAASAHERGEDSEGSGLLDVLPSSGHLPSKGYGDVFASGELTLVSTHVSSEVLLTLGGGQQGQHWLSNLDKSCMFDTRGGQHNVGPGKMSGYEVLCRLARERGTSPESWVAEPTLEGYLVKHLQNKPVDHLRVVHHSGHVILQLLQLFLHNVAVENWIHNGV